MPLQQALKESIENARVKHALELEEHTAKIKAKIESGSAIDKSIIDREANKELNHKEAHSKAKVVKAIEHRIIKNEQLDIYNLHNYTTIIIDATIQGFELLADLKYLPEDNYHIYIIANDSKLRVIKKWSYTQFNKSISLLTIFIHTFKYSSRSNQPKIGYKEHFEYIMYINLNNKPVNHLLPNVIESTYAKDSRNLGFYTNLLLRSANADDTILGINITNGNLIKAAQAMLCSTVIIPADNIAMRECEKTIKELQFK